MRRIIRLLRRMLLGEADVPVADVPVPLVGYDYDVTLRIIWHKSLRAI